MEDQPVTDKELIEAMKNDLKKRNYRDYILMLIQLNEGLKIGDVISLKVKDIRGKSYLDITERKTKEVKHFLLNGQLKDELNDYIKRMDDDDYLFPSRKIKEDGTKCYISKIQANRILADSARRVGIKDLSKHSLRKTFS